MSQNEKYYQGPNGEATQLQVNPGLSGFEATVTWWLLTGPWHPIWPQFLLSVVNLKPITGLPEPKLQFLDATHELVVMALYPGDDKSATIHEAKTLEEGGLHAVGGFLEPVDVCHQFIATDEEMTQLADLIAKGCVDGLINPSTDDNRPYYREEWLSVCVRTLAHLRGEVHAP